MNTTNTSLLIPKIIHRIWVGTLPMPEEFKYYEQTWKTHHPDWEIKLWTDDNMIPLQNQKAYDEAKQMAKKADIARYELLYRFGGVYADCDVECVKNIEPMLGGIEAFAGAEDDYYISTVVFGCTPLHPLMKYVVDSIEDSITQNSMLGTNYQTGPVFFTKLLKNIPEFVVFDKEFCCPYLWSEKHRKGEKFENSYAIHHWAGNWN